MTETSKSSQIKDKAFELVEGLLSDARPSARNLEAARQWLRASTANLVGPWAERRSEIHKKFEEKLYRVMATEPTPELLKVATRYGNDPQYTPIGFSRHLTLDAEVPFQDTPDNLR